MPCTNVWYVPTYMSIYTCTYMVQWSCVLLYDIYMRIYVYLATVVATEASTTGEGPLQLDVGDIGASVIEYLPAGVSAQCKLHALYACMHVYMYCVCIVLYMYISTYVCMYVCMYVVLRMCVCMYVCTYEHTFVCV